MVSRRGGKPTEIDTTTDAWDDGSCFERTASGGPCEGVNTFLHLVGGSRVQTKPYNMNEGNENICVRVYAPGFSILQKNQ